MFPCSLGLLRAASPTGRALRAPPATTTSTIRNGRPASSHRAVFGGPVFRLCGLRFALCPRGFSRFAASDESRTPLLIGLTTACFRHRRRPSCAPLQFPLKSYGFPGAETARKRFLLWKMGFSDAKIAPPPSYTPPGTMEVRKGFAPLFGFSTGCCGHKFPLCKLSHGIWGCEKQQKFFHSPIHRLGSKPRPFRTSSSPTGKALLPAWGWDRQNAALPARNGECALPKFLC